MLLKEALPLVLEVGSCGGERNCLVAVEFLPEMVLEALY